MPTETPEPFGEDDLNLDWSVSRVLEARSPMFAWHGSVHLPVDPDDPVSGEQSGELGSIVAYAAPRAADEPSTWDDFDSISGDVETIASAVCGDGAGLSMRILEKYGDVLKPGLLIIDRVNLDPRVRGRGAARVAFSELVVATANTGLVACYPSPIPAEGFPELNGDPRARAQRRIAKHWRQHGFKRLSGGSGVLVAHPDDLVTGEWAERG